VLGGLSAACDAAWDNCEWCEPSPLPSPSRRLWLDRNALKSLPEELEDCTNLQELYLDQNPELHDVPPSLTLLPSLRKLYLGESR
jgi:Leucine-rich repeat (LRR) protein